MMMWSEGANTLYYSYIATYFEFMKQFEYIGFDKLGLIVPRGAGEGNVKFVKFDPAEL